MNQYINQQADICFYESDFNISILFERESCNNFNAKRFIWHFSHDLAEWRKWSVNDKTSKSTLQTWVKPKKKEAKHLGYERRSNSSTS